MKQKFSRAAQSVENAISKCAVVDRCKKIDALFDASDLQLPSAMRRVFLGCYVPFENDRATDFYIVSRSHCSVEHPNGGQTPQTSLEAAVLSA